MVIEAEDKIETKNRFVVSIELDGRQRIFIDRGTMSVEKAVYMLTTALNKLVWYNAPGDF